MRTMIKSSLLFALLVFSLALQAAEQPVRTFQKIIDSGELRVGVALFPPWVMQSKNGDLIGSETDIARKLARDMGLELKYSLFQWSELIPALESGEVDVVISGMAITPKRAMKVKFSQPYAENGVGLVANKSLTHKFRSLKEMKQPEVTIGVVKGTVSEKVGRRAFEGASFKTFTAEDKAEEALLKGQLHAVVLSNPGPKFMVLKYPGKLDQPLSKPLLGLREAFAVNKNQSDLVDYLDSWIYAREADDSLATIRQYWFESLSWQDQL